MKKRTQREELKEGSFVLEVSPLKRLRVGEDTETREARVEFASLQGARALSYSSLVDNYVDLLWKIQALIDPNCAS